MQPDSSRIYSCKQCATKVRGREQLQPHLHWHYISDENVDDYFSEVEEETAAPPPDATQIEMPPRRKSEPSYGVLLGCVAILGLLAIAYFLSN